MKYTINEFRKEYPNDDVCLDKIFAMRYASMPCSRPSRVCRRRPWVGYLCFIKSILRRVFFQENLQGRKSPRKLIRGLVMKKFRLASTCFPSRKAR